MSWRIVVVYTKFLGDILSSVENTDMGFRLYQEEKKINISKYVELILSPLLINLNSKRIQSYLYSELRKISDETCYELKETVNEKIVNYLDCILEKLPYPVDYNLNLDEVALFKQYDVKIKYEGETIFEKTLDYIKISAALCQTKVLVFANVKAYFSSVELEELYKVALYNKIRLVMVENQQHNCIHVEKYYIIDEDKCFIIQE